ncbi:MAG: hypothetical protein M3275_15015, partial [Thermoproteota archaeon]|nr:hypothetical protein [Thermoproteota archaeon]
LRLIFAFFLLVWLDAPCIVILACASLAGGLFFPVISFYPFYDFSLSILGDGQVSPPFFKVYPRK